MTETNKSKTTFIAASVLFLAAFGLYLWCFQPAGSWGDGVDFMLCSYFLGVPHPTGYPAVALLGKIATLVPLGTIGMRAGLLSSMAGALVPALLFFVIVKIAKNSAAAFWGAAAFGLTNFFWSTSATNEVYALNLFFCMAMILIFTKEDDFRAALAFFPVAALGLGNHGTLFIPAFFLGLFLLVRAMRASRPATGFLAVTFLVICVISEYLCLPMFSARSAVFNWNNPQIFHNMPNLLSGYDFWVIGEYIPAQMWQNFLRLSGEINAQVSAAAALLFLAGITWKRVPARDRAAILAVFVLAGAFPILYPTREKESFFLISYAILVIFAAVGLGRIVSGAKPGSAAKIIAAAVVAAACAHAAWLLKSNRLVFSENRNTTPAIYSDALFLSARRDAMVFVDHLADDTLYPPVYSQFVDGRRPDVFLFYRLYLAFPWYLDAMRSRAAELGFAASAPRIDLAAERSKNIEVGIEEKQRIELGKTMNTIAIDVLTARILDANRGRAPVYINTPNRFRKSRISAPYAFSPAGAIFRWQPSPGFLYSSDEMRVPRVLSGVGGAADPVFIAALKEMHVQRGIFFSEAAAYARGSVSSAPDAGKAYKLELLLVAAEVEAALQYGDDCVLRGVLADTYERLGDPKKAAEQSDLAARCRLKRYDIR